MLGSAEAVSFLPSADLARSERFYADVLGLELVSRSPFADVFRCGTATLRLARVDDLRPQPFTVFGWLVPDLRSVAGELRARGIELLRYDGLGQDDDAVWRTPAGDLVAWFQDPDRNVLSVTEMAAR